MAKKETVTIAEIEKDIRSRLKQGVDMLEDDYNKGNSWAWLYATVLFVFSIIAPFAFTTAVLVLLLAIIVITVVKSILNFYKIKKISIDDYEIKTDIVHSTSEEHYMKQQRRYAKVQVDNYMIRFENGGVWRIAKKNYSWSVERPMSDWYIFENAHRGDVFITVTERSTGTVMMAYDTEFFEYKN